MKIEKLKLNNFRLYESLEIDLNNRTNIFFGDNAQGKTTIIEAINVIGLTKSHKTNKDKDLIKINAEYAKINAVINLKEKDIQLDIILSKVGKKAKYNQIELDRLSDYIGQLNVVLFAPEDMDLIKGNPQNRRKFLDLEIGQISKEYLHNLQNYRKILKQRNELLKSLQTKQEKDLMLLDIITDQLIEYLVIIVEMRKSFIHEINEFAQKIYKYISKDDKKFNIKYLPNVEKNIKKEFVSKYQYDIITGTTNIGVHRDDIEFYLDDFHVKTHGSQGELRSSVLSTKLALIDFIYKHKNEHPVLLLDDVLSELDSSRQNRLLSYINQKTQTIITTTDLKDINLNNIDSYAIYHVHNGRVEESDKNG